jgi:hypothetical protein
MATACGGPAVGVLSKILFAEGASPHTFGASSERYEILMDGDPAENFQRHGRLIGGQGITGKIYRIKQRVRKGGYFVFGRMIINPSNGAFSTLLKYLVGTDAGGGVFTPGNCLNPFGVLKYMDSYTHEFKDGVVSRWILQGSGVSFKERGTPDLLTLAIDCIFKDDVWNTTSWPASEPGLPTAANYTPYVFQDCSGQVVIEGSAREIYGFRIDCKNKIKPRWANSFAASSFVYAGKEVSLGLQFPFDATNDDLYEPTTAGAEATLTFDLGAIGSEGLYTEFKFTNLRIPERSPYVQDEFDITFENEGVAFGDGATEVPEILVTNIDS